jgi:two-component system, NarL family, response regulator DevR
MSESPPRSARPRAIIFDRYRLLRDAVETVLDGCGVTVVAKATTSDETVAQVEEHQPDLLVVGLPSALDSTEVVALVRDVVARWPDLKVIVLSSSSETDVAEEIFDAGAAAFISKNASHDDVGLAIRQTYEPSIHFSSRLAPRAKPASRPSETTLTDRELEILRHVVRGQSNGKVAAALRVTEQTVKFHLSNIFRKLGVSNRTQAARRAYQLQIVGDDSRDDVEASALIRQ